MIQHHEHLYRDLAHPLKLLSRRSSDTALAKFWHYSRSESQSSEEHSRMETYSELMRDTQSLVADEILSSYSFNQHKSVLDVGGGDGRFLRAVHARAPELNLSLLELPTVAKLATAQLQEHDISATVHEGDMFESVWPQGADLICLVRVALDHDDEAVAKLFSRARQALPPEGVLLVAEPMSDSPKVGHAYFGMYLWAMGSGRARKSQELSDMLGKAGFSRVDQLKTGLPDLVRIIKAT
ncbi:MAG: methyltransferase [Pseudomonadota bacterium]